MKALSITRKTIREAWREPSMLALLVCFPALLIMIYCISFNPSGSGMSQLLRLVVINQDQGAAGAQFTRMLQDAQFDHEVLFSVRQVTARADAETILRERKAAMLILIPPDFTTALSQNGQPGLDIVGDSTFDYYVFATGFLKGMIEQFGAAYRGQNPPPPAAMLEFVSGTGTLTDLQFGIPGTLVFGVMIGVIYIAMIVVREQVSGTLQRFRLTRATAADLLIGIGFAEVILAVLQIILAFGVALLFNFQSTGSLILAVLIGVLVSLSVTGMGLISACVSRSDGQAAMVATAIMIPVVFLSNTIFPMPPMPIATIAGRVINLYDFLPTAHASEAMRRVLIYGDRPSAIAFELIALTVLTSIFLGVGVLVFHQRRIAL